MQRQSEVLRTVAKLVGPSVVHIVADLDDKKKGQIEEAGSGVIVKRNDRYYVLTNRHVIRDAAPPDVRIKLCDRRWIKAENILIDKATDVAVISVDAPNLIEANIGDSDRMQTGDFVLAMGSPFGLSHSVTFGIVSARNRRNLQLGDPDVEFQDFLQTDAAIHPGNSGGPLVNLRGEVIGINTAIASHTGRNEGVGFAIPSNMLMKIARQLIDKGEVERAFLGVKIDSSFGPAMAAEVGLPRPIGARITSVNAGSPAEAAGLRVNDVILKFQNTPVDDCSHLVNMIGVTPVDTPAELVIFRDHEQIVLTVKLGSRE
ncbi:MAG: trypsin-like peptidase domain-containing protein [Pirellulales bacterium]|nr:trypsin-like peptidase domain-containing protein [Pirellulales bacterium]